MGLYSGKLWRDGKASNFWVPMGGKFLIKGQYLMPVATLISQLPTCEFTPFRGLDDNLFNCLGEVILACDNHASPIVMESMPVDILDIHILDGVFDESHQFLFRPENFIPSGKFTFAGSCHAIATLSYRWSLAPRQFYSSTNM
jgi:hypothetical protein